MRGFKSSVAWFKMPIWREKKEWKGRGQIREYGIQEHYAVGGIGGGFPIDSLFLK